MAQLLDTLTQVMINTNNNNNHGGKSGNEDNSINNRTPNHRVPTTSSRPMIPTFPPRVEHEKDNEPTLVELQDQFHQDWIDGGLQIDMSLRDYMDIRMKHFPNKGNRDYYNYLRRKIGKLSLPYFDGSGKTTARVWVQRLIHTSNSTKCQRTMQSNMLHYI